MKVIAILGRLLVGGALFAFGALFLWRELSIPPTHNGHIYLFAGIAVLGALVIDPDPIISGASRAAKVIVVFIPGTQARADRLSGARPAVPPDPPAAP